MKRFDPRLGALAATLLATTAIATSALADNVFLIAAPYTREMPAKGGGTVPVPMWGYFRVPDGPTQVADFKAAKQNDWSWLADLEPAQPIDLANHSTLQVRLLNLLPVATSLVIPPLGDPQVGPAPASLTDPTRVWIEDDGTVTSSETRPNASARIYSMVDEVPAFSGAGTFANASKWYAWSSVRPGSYIYQSGTHPAAQVQMGLAGPMHRDALAPTSAGKLRPFAASDRIDAEHDLFLSEIDLEAHQAIDAAVPGDGSQPHPRFEGLLRYEPDYFLVNGEMFNPDVAASGYTPPLELKAGKQYVLRLYNAGLETHEQALTSGHMDIISEDGMLYPYPRRNYSAQLTAGQTRDALYSPTVGDHPDLEKVAVFDPMRDGPNPQTGLGGMVTVLAIAHNAPPTANAIVVSGTRLPTNALIVRGNDIIAKGDVTDPDGNAIYIDSLQIVSAGGTPTSTLPAGWQINTTAAGSFLALRASINGQKNVSYPVAFSYMACDTVLPPEQGCTTANLTVVDETQAALQ